MKFTCSECGKEHDDWPALAFDAPVYYYELSSTDKLAICELTTDFCVIRHPGQTDRFIRCVINQKVVGECKSLHYGVWVSLSEKSFNDYKENYDNKNHETQYFGWLSNNILGYDHTTSVPLTVITSNGNQRPEVFPHDDFDHQFVLDYYNGISKEEAERRIKVVIESSVSNEQ
jgi:hypothetical protein